MALVVIDSMINSVDMSEPFTYEIEKYEVLKTQFKDYSPDRVTLDLYLSLISRINEFHGNTRGKFDLKMG